MADIKNNVLRMQIVKLHREKAPDFHTIKKLSVLVPERVVAKNGIPIYLFPIQDQEIVKVDFVFDAGNFIQSQSPLTPLSTLAMLQEGSLTQSGEQIAERLDFLGSYMYTQSTKDASIISVCCLEKYLAETIKIVADFITTPTFPDDNFQTHIRKREERYKVDNERVEIVSQRKMNAILFGETHPYGQNASLSDFSNLSIAELQSFYSKNYVSENCSIVVCGNPKSSEIKNLIEMLKHNDIQKKSKKIKENTDWTLHSNEQRKYYIEKENAVQSSINIGKIVVNRNHQDFVQLQVLNTILGGYFGSRLMSNVREDKGFTYGIGSGIISYKKAGYFLITTRVGKNVVEPALEAIYYEMKKLRENLVPQEELEMVKTYMLSTLVRNFDGALATSEMFRNTIGYDLEFETYSQNYWRTIQHIKSEKLIDLANKYFTEDSMYEVVVG